MSSLLPDAQSVKCRLTEPWAVIHALGIAEGAKRQARGALVLCPAHRERSASCSVREGDDGTIAVRCFACGFAGDVFSLIAAVRGLDVGRDFPRIIEEAADIAGMRGTAPLPALPSRPPRTVHRPPVAEVGSLWARCGMVCDDRDLSLRLFARRLDPAVITDRDLARALPASDPLPRWAGHARRSWRDSGHTLLVGLWDADGELASVHARSFLPDTDPKGLSPAGHRSAGLVMACSFARELLRGGLPSWWHRAERPTVIIVEGVPDFLTVGIRYGDWEYSPALLGVVSGAWSRDVADRIPDGCRVIVRTHRDDSGLKYEADVAESLAARCRVEVLPAPEASSHE